MLPRISLFLALVLSISSSAAAAQSVSTRSNSIQDAYDRITLAYELGDLDAIADIYAEDAMYILPDTNRGVVVGRDSIRAVYEGFFEAAALQQAQLTIDFRFVSRNMKGDIAYDVGYYRVRVLHDGEVTSASTGKFSTVLRRADNGQWRFVVDAYSKAPDEAYDALAPAQTSSRQ
ncbi:hypothetical protein CRI94_06440 [Longibacter salinarum]|uniref:DUF4440 domain-containing protein n=1 Tax=Longibacter salinarum TaxID=1850348 RepID=A0A2A8CYA1_9BACT|nr:SgcJ/EcaC family oxidoreductase [Longibacter salinarum]PEN13709.1 hypothetical protein CRI94_06440 [Longibacter salinarum]